MALDEFEVDISDLDFLTEYGIKRGIFYFKEVFDNSYLLSCALYVTTKFLNYTYSVFTNADMEVYVDEIDLESKNNTICLNRNFEYNISVDLSDFIYRDADYLILIDEDKDLLLKYIDLKMKHINELTLMTFKVGIASFNEIISNLITILNLIDKNEVSKGITISATEWFNEEKCLDFLTSLYNILKSTKFNYIESINLRTPPITLYGYKGVDILYKLSQFCNVSGIGI